MRDSISIDINFEIEIVITYASSEDLGHRNLLSAS